MPRERLQKVIAASGIASRRGAEELIRAGRVMVDGSAAYIGQQVDPVFERVAVDGKPLPAEPGPREYWLLNKPAGVVSTVKDRHADRTVLDLMPTDARISRLYPVGRLDEDSEGLLLMTNDGGWTELLLHPRYGVEREYMAGLDRSLTKQQKLALRGGIELEEGLARVDALDDATPAQIRKLEALLAPPYPEYRWYRVVLAQGWKRQIRRMFDVVGQPVRRLVRVRVGNLKLTDVGVGESRRLTSHEVRQLAACARAETTTRPPKTPKQALPGVAPGAVPAEEAASPSWPAEPPR
jgi:23S rRNA pseudouridine2605 synthase